MTEAVFLTHGVEIDYTADGKKAKQSLPNLKETFSSAKMVALGQLFVEMNPTAVVKMDEVVTVKRTRHQSL